MNRIYLQLPPSVRYPWEPITPACTDRSFHDKYFSVVPEDSRKLLYAAFPVLLLLLLLDGGDFVSGPSSPHIPCCVVVQSLYSVHV